MCQRAYTIDPDSAHFLLQHGFDFNKQIARGIPYTPSPMKVIAPSRVVFSFSVYIVVVSEILSRT